MASTLREAMESLCVIKIERPIRRNKISDELLGKFKGILPSGKSSTQFIKELRSSLYGKTK